MGRVAKSDNSNWKIEDKQRAVAAYSATGSFLKSSKLIGIPDATIRSWAKQDWWEEELRRADQSETNELKSTYTRIAKRASELLEDRLDNGDEVVTKAGDIVKKQIPGRELAIIAAVATDKRKQAMEQPHTVALQSSTERLGQLVEQFIRFSSAKQIVGTSKEVIDAKLEELRPELHAGETERNSSPQESAGDAQRSEGDHG